MRIIHAYDGGLAATEAIPWLRARYRADVVTVTLDLGQGRALEAIRDRARAAGAVRAHVVDAREAFARDVLVPALRADVDGVSPKVLGQAIGGPTLVEMARIERAVAMAHTCPAAAAERSRLEAPVRALNPALTIIAVAAEHPVGEADLAAFARAHQLAPPAAHEPGAAVDANLWGRTLTVAPPTTAPPESAFVLTRPLSACPDEAAVVDLQFDGGVPVSVNGVAMPFLDLVQSVVTIAGAHGVGRRQRDGEWIEAPAAAVLHLAHRTLQERLWDADTRAFAATVSARDTELLQQGGWSIPLRGALDAFVVEAQRRITGSVRIQLFKGQASTAAADSDRPPHHR